MLILLTFVHVVVSLFLILVVLLQQGKGADLSVFGGGGTQAAFGARGATTILHKLTVTSFIIFIVTTVSIGIFKTGGLRDSVLGGLPEAVEETVETPEPAVPVAGEDEGEAEESDAGPAIDAAVQGEDAGAGQTGSDEEGPADGDAEQGS